MIIRDGRVSIKLPVVETLNESNFSTYGFADERNGFENSIEIRMTISTFTFVSPLPTIR